MRAEAGAQKENSAQVRVLTSLGNLPLVVLSHDPDKVRFPGNLSEPVNRERAKCKKSWRTCPRTARTWWSRGAATTQIDKPEAVVDAIRKVVGQAKGAS